MLFLKKRGMGAPMAAAFSIMLPISASRYHTATIGRNSAPGKNEIYYGNFSDPFVIYMQVLTTKEDHGVQVADRIHVILLSTDTRKNPIERMQQQSMKNGLYSALEIGTIWLEKALKEAAKA